MKKPRHASSAGPHLGRASSWAVAALPCSTVSGVAKGRMCGESLSGGLRWARRLLTGEFRRSAQTIESARQATGLYPVSQAVNPTAEGCCRALEPPESAL